MSTVTVPGMGHMGVRFWSRAALGVTVLAGVVFGLVWLGGSSSKWKDFGYDVSVAVLGFVLTLAGAFIIFRIQRSYATKDRVGQEREAEQERSRRELARTVEGFYAELPHGRTYFRNPHTLEWHVSKFRAELTWLAVRMPDPKLQWFCSEYADTLALVGEYSGFVPYRRRFWRVIGVYRLSALAAMVLAEYLRHGGELDAGPFDAARQGGRPLEALWKLGPSPRPSAPLVVSASTATVLA